MDKKKKSNYIRVAVHEHEWVIITKSQVTTVFVLLWLITLVIEKHQQA